MLILPCSKQKKQVSTAPALELYDGPFYRVLRKNMPLNLDVFILSAKYGLISSNKIISNYDQMMTLERAHELEDDISIELKEIFKKDQYDDIFINLGKIYMLALEKSENLLSRYNVTLADGQIGERLHQLKGWLTKIAVEDAT